MAIVLCIAAFFTTLIFANISLAWGLTCTFAVGYFFGVIRANIPQAFSHFIFDCAVLALFLAQLPKALNKARYQPLKRWTMLLIGWPTLLLLLPVQDYLIQLVGWRGSAFFIPFMLLGTKLKPKDITHLAIALGLLNLVAFGFSVVEYFYGIDHFFPKTKITSIIYESNLEEINAEAHRIPATFSNAHSYAGMMVMTLPFIVGAWLNRSSNTLIKWLLIASLLAAVLGVFMSATRTNAVALFTLILATGFARRMRVLSRFGLLILILCVARVVSSEEKMQRFTTLQDTDNVKDRVTISMNAEILKIITKFPMGNGLGGGGTSLPYFLESRVQNRQWIENEYVRIWLEQGIIGFFMWLLFIFWFINIRKRIHPKDPWYIGRRLGWFACLVYFVVAFIGLGLFTSIPQSCAIFLVIGWLYSSEERRISVQVPNAQSSPPNRISDPVRPQFPALPDNPS